jgi:hypothetical protein
MPISYEPIRLVGSATIYATIDEVWLERPYGVMHGMALINFSRVAVWKFSDQGYWHVELEPETLRRRRPSQIEPRELTSQ